MTCARCRWCGAFAALLDLDTSIFCEGVPLPHGWHFLLFTPQDATSALPGDGYPLCGAGQWAVACDARRPGAWSFMASCRSAHACGAPVRSCRSRKKTGHSGNIRIVTREHRIFADNAAVPCIVEQEDMIQREAAAAAPANASPKTPTLRRAQHSRIVVPAEVLLFRYSAVDLQRTQNPFRLSLCDRGGEI
ncbi:MAG: hypothetical protein WDM89_07120 [Rhizomicrobium sp.]